MAASNGSDRPRGARAAGICSDRGERDETAESGRFYRTDPLVIPRACCGVNWHAAVLNQPTRNKRQTLHSVPYIATLRNDRLDCTRCKEQAKASAHCTLPSRFSRLVYTGVQVARGANVTTAHRSRPRSWRRQGTLGNRGAVRPRAVAGVAAHAAPTGFDKPSAT